MVKKKALAILSVAAIVSAMIPMSVSAAEATVTTKSNCEVAVEDGVITVTANEGYEFGKLNVNGITVPANINENGKTATYTLPDPDTDVTIDAVADPERTLSMTQMTADEFASIFPDIITTGNTAVYKTLPAEYTDYDPLTINDFGKYPAFTVFDAGEGNKYKLTEIITYARTQYEGRVHLKIYGTDSLTDVTFNNTAGANTETLTSLTHDEDVFFGTGSWTGNNTKYGYDAVRGDYLVDTNPGYRYIVIASDNNNMLSLGGLKVYGELITDEPETHDSDYFSFTAAADEMNEFNTIAIKLRDTTTDDVTAKAAAFSSSTVFSGEGDVQGLYAVKITDLPENLEVEAVKLYVE